MKPDSGLVCGYPRFAGLLLLTMLAVLGGCRSGGLEREIARQSVQTLYDNAHRAMLRNDFEYSSQLYEALTSRYPFTEQARQARLDLIYLYYRRGDKESATDAADQFLLENPTHPRCDYAWYMKGLIEFERTPYAFERWFGVNMARRPPTTIMTAITAFGTVVQRYPKSEYAHDARRRMIYLRNRMAEYEVNVARYYVKRGAWLAAAQRSQRVLEQYEGAPATRDALEIMMESYERLDLDDLKVNTEKIYALNFPGSQPQPAAGRSWWRFW